MVDENYDKKEEAEEKDRKCPPQFIPFLNPNEEWAASHKPEEWIAATIKSIDDCSGVPGTQSSTRTKEEEEPNVIAQKHGAAVAMEKAVLFDEKEKIKSGASGQHVLASKSNQLWVSNEDRNAGDTLDGQPNDSLGAEAVDKHGQHCSNVTRKRRSWFLQFIPHGAFREGGSDIEEGHEEDEFEEDEFTVSGEEENEMQTPIAAGEKLIDPISAELVNTEEEERRLQEKINQALERERQKAVVAEVAPVDDGDSSQSDAHRFGITRRRRWFVIGAILLIVVAITTVLAVTLPQDPSNCGKDGYFGPNCDLYYPNCSVMNPELIGNGLCDPDEFYTEECGWDGGDCIGCKDGYFGRHCDLEYPNCSGVDPLLVQYPMALGAGICEGQPFNTEECGWDGGDCIRCNDGYFGPYCDLDYPNCSVPDPAWIGDSGCDGLPYNVEECGWDGGDCCAPGYFGRNCEVTGYPNCSVAIPNWIGDGECDEEGNYNTTECGWDGGDCL